MALNYSDNIIYQIRKGEVTYDVQDAIAKAAIESLESTVEEHAQVTAAALTDLDSRLDDIEAVSVTVEKTAAWDAKYDKPNTGIPATDLASAVQTSLGKADTALQANDITGKADKVTSATSGNFAGLDANGNLTDSGSKAADFDVAGAATAAQTAAEATAAADATSKVNAAKSELIGASTDLTTADTIHGAKNYAKDLVDTILGEDSASTTLATLKQVIQELNAPENQDGMAGTFIDTVKAGLSGLGNTEPVYYTQEEIDAAHEGDDAYGKTTNDIKTPARSVTVKEYVDNAVSGASSSASAAIQALDAEETSADGTNVQVKVTEVDGVITAVSVTTDNTVNSGDVSSAITSAIEALDADRAQTAGTDGLALSLTQVDGVVTAISGSIAANTYDAHGAAAAVLGASGDTASANTVYGAKAAAAAVLGASGDAASDNTVYGAKAYTDAAITNLGSSSISNGVLTLAL